MSDIDWSKAPSHATHWCPGNAQIEAGWIYQAGGEFYSCYSDRGLEHIPDFPAWRKARLVPRPTAWTGDVLPPVGTVCEVAERFISGGEFVRVVAHDEGGVVGRYLSGDNIGSYTHFISGELVPIRTHEQIAEEERKAAIEEMAALMKESRYSVLSTEISPYEMAKAYADRLYQAGYRKAGDA